MEIPATRRSADSFTFAITPAEISDASDISKLGSALWTTSFGWSVSPENLDAYLQCAYTPQAWEKELTNPTSAVFVARSGGSASKILGFVQLSRVMTEPCLESVEGRLVELQKIYVDAETHGKGLGKALIKHVENEAKREGFDYMWLGVWGENQRAQKLYESQGFRKVGEHDFLIGDEAQTDWILLKKL